MPAVRWEPAGRSGGSACAQPQESVSEYLKRALISLHACACAHFDLVPKSPWLFAARAYLFATVTTINVKRSKQFWWISDLLRQVRLCKHLHHQYRGQMVDKSHRLEADVTAWQPLLMCQYNKHDCPTLHIEVWTCYHSTSQSGHSVIAWRIHHSHLSLQNSRELSVTKHLVRLWNGYDVV